MAPALQSSGSGLASAPSQSLYRRYRPRSFKELVGQEAVAKTLENAISAGRIHHAYLFVGSRGTGKTSTAKILAACLNCIEGPTANPCGRCDRCLAIAHGSSLDVVELDAASHNSVDDVRALRETIAFAPTTSYRVYILDEAHMLSNAAWNALLKTLEEPPPRTVFVLATTEAQRVPPTVVDRCHRFDFRRPTVRQITELLLRVAAEEGIALDPEAALLLARRATGSFRDSLGLLEQVVTYAGQEVRAEDVLALLGGVSEESVAVLLEAIGNGEAARALAVVEELLGSGQDPQAVLEELEERGRELLVVCVLGEVPAELSFGEEADGRQLRLAQAVGEGRLLALLDRVGYAREAIRAGASPRTQLELAVVRAARGEGRDGGGRPQAVQSPGGHRKPAPTAPANGAVRRSPQKARPEGGLPSASAANEPPPKQAAANQPAAAGGTEEAGADRSAPLTLEKVVAQWPAAIERTRQTDLLLAGLLDGARPVGVEGETVTIGFPPGKRFARKKAEQPARLALLTTTLRGLLGTPITLAFAFDERLEDHQAGQEEEVIDLFFRELEAEELPAEGAE
jgi:DNA polymerase-3 subunit gamma/tau